METLESPTEIQTRCPTCQTVFEISNDITNSDDPRVRCGECYSIFNSRDHTIISSLPDDLLVDVAGSSDEFDHAEIDQPSTPDLEETIVFEPENQDLNNAQAFDDIDLFSENADLPELGYFDDGEEIPELDFDSIDPENDQFDGTLFDDVNLDYEETELLTQEQDWAEPFTSKDKNASVSTPTFSNAESVEDPLDSVVYSSSDTKRNKSGFWFRRSMMVLILAIGLGGLFVYSNRVKFQKSPLTTPLVRWVCAIADCEVSNPASFDDLHVLRRDVYSHPKVQNALIINIVFRNEATVSQPYPTLAITMSDMNGEIVAQRDFLPFEYLKIDKLDVPSVIDSEQTVEISLEVSDPGDSAKSFELDFKQ